MSGRLVPVDDDRQMFEGRGGIEVQQRVSDHAVCLDHDGFVAGVPAHLHELLSELH